MKNIKSIIIGTLVVLAIGLVIFGPAKVRSHAIAGRERINKGIDEISPDAQEAARIRVLLWGFDEDVIEYRGKLADVEHQLSADRKAQKKLEAGIGSQREILSREQELLNEEQAAYEIQGRTYTRQQLEEDALARISHSKSLQRELELKNQVVAQLSVALRDGRKNLSKAMAARREKAEELTVLEARLQAANMLNQVAEIAKDLGDAPLAPRSELGKALRNFEKRVQNAERRNDGLSTDARGGLVIDWDGGIGVNASQALDEFLGSSSSDEPATATAAIDLSRALEVSIVD